MNELAYIPFHVPCIGEEEIQEVVAVLRSGWLTTGSRTHRLESDFRSYTGARFALAVNSGTAAMHLALAASGIGPGDEVITTPLTFCATVNTIIHTGATPILADIGPDGNIDPDSAATRITPRTRALLPVHYGGLPCDMEALWGLARRHGLTVVEDAAHAAGTRYQGACLGSEVASRSAAVAFSFYATKNMTTAEGGMVTCNDAEMAETMRRLALHGINKDAWNRYAEHGSWFYTVQEPGFKYNLSDLQSALGIHQLAKLESFTERRTQIAALYSRLLGEVDELELPAESKTGRNAWHLYVIRLRLDRLTEGRDAFIEQLRRQGVGASVHFIPIPMHPFFAPWAALSPPCLRAAAFYERILSLPIYPSLSEEDVRTVVERIKRTVAALRKARAFAVASAQDPGEARPC